jgi:hypothetical protein
MQAFFVVMKTRVFISNLGKTCQAKEKARHLVWQSRCRPMALLLPGPTRTWVMFAFFEPQE